MNITPRYLADEDRYDGRMPYRRTGASGLKLPEVSLGLWHNFGDDRTLDSQRAILRRAFDLGVTHFDLANNYGPPYGSAESNFGTLFAQDFRPYRDELVISTKAGYDMWPGPYGEWGSRKYLLASPRPVAGAHGPGLRRHLLLAPFDPETPLEETMGALATAVQQGKALYVGISSYSPEKTHEAARILREMGVRLLIHQPSYSMLNRWIEDDRLLDATAEEGMGCIAFSPLAQGLLTSRYLGGDIPAGSRASLGHFLKAERVTADLVARLNRLNQLASGRGQTLAQMATSWVLRDPRMTSALIGASSVKQLEENVAAVANTVLRPGRARADRRADGRGGLTPGPPGPASDRAPGPVIAASFRESENVPRTWGKWVCRWVRCSRRSTSAGRRSRPRWSTPPAACCAASRSRRRSRTWSARSWACSTSSPPNRTGPRCRPSASAARGPSTRPGAPSARSTSRTGGTSRWPTGSPATRACRSPWPATVSPWPPASTGAARPAAAGTRCAWWSPPASAAA